jgi:hypothetical protein
MLLLTFKLILAPALIALATLAGRRWGQGVSGWFAGLPLTSGPVSLIFALQSGTEFAASAATGTIAGLASVAVFCLVYTRLAPRLAWGGTAALAVTGFALATAATNSAPLALFPTFILVVGFILVVIRLIPSPTVAIPDPPRRAGDLIARMVLAAGFVLGLTSVSELIGAQLSGLLSPFPIFASVLSVFAHRHQGAAAAIHFLRGLAFGLVAFASFFLVVGAFVTEAPLAATYAGATVAAVVVNALSLRFAR